MSLEQLRATCRDWKGPRAAHARAALAFVRERVDSPMETRLRMLIVLAGLPEPRVNITYGEGDGLTYRRYDLSWPEIKLIVEYDGRHHIERVEQWESDLTRREAIDDSGWRILERRLPGVPKTLRTTWQRHFPGRD